VHSKLPTRVHAKQSPTERIGPGDILEILTVTQVIDVRKKPNSNVAGGS